MSRDAGPRTILVVEDEAMLLMVVAETLRDAGYQVIEAGNGAAAIQALKEHPEIEMLLSDIKMPGMNGYELVQEALTMRPALKVALMTGYTQDPMPARFAEARVRVLYKPFNFDVLPEFTGEVLSSA